MASIYKEIAFPADCTHHNTRLPVNGVSTGSRSVFN